MPAAKTVASVLDELAPEPRELVDALRRLVAGTHDGLREHLKWGSPTYSLGDRDVVTINLHNKHNRVHVVLHQGATTKEDRMGSPVLVDDGGIVTWVSDIRGLIPIADQARLIEIQNVLCQVLVRWIELTAPGPHPHDETQSRGRSGRISE